MKPLCPGCNNELAILNHYHIDSKDYDPIIPTDSGYYDDFECDACALEYLMPEKILTIMGEEVFKGDWDQACRAFKLKAFL